jgi:CheY-like chemotaxis protein
VSESSKRRSAIEELSMPKASRRQILLVDDNPSVLETLAMLLMRAGYDVAVAEDGFAALSQLRKTVPDVVVSDLEMPRMSGFELLSVVRRRFPQILTVATSGACPEDCLPLCVIADGFYAKGGQPKNLLRAIEQLITSASAHGGPHRREVAPAWIPRNGNDSNGIPYVMVTCEECLRVFQLAVIEEMTGQVLEVPCRFCPGKNRYIIEPSVQSGREACG